MAKWFSLIILFVMVIVAPLQAEEAVSSLFISEDDISAAVKKEFIEQGLDDEIELEFFAGQTSFVLENTKKAKLMVSKLKYDQEQNKFNAEADVFADGKPIARTQLQGRYYLLEETAVPTKNIIKGSIIKADDLKMVKMRRNRIKPNHITMSEKLIDMEAKRSLKEGKLISNREVGKIVLIKKGDVITSIYKTDKMQITAKAEALNDGVRGQKIEAVNTKSKKKMYGIVIDADTIEVNVQ